MRYVLTLSRSNQRVEFDTEGFILSGLTPHPARVQTGSAYCNGSLSQLLNVRTSQQVLTSSEEQIVYAMHWNHSKDRFLKRADLVGRFSRPAVFITDACSALRHPVDNQKRNAAFLHEVTGVLQNNGRSTSNFLKYFHQNLPQSPAHKVDAGSLNVNQLVIRIDTSASAQFCKPLCHTRGASRVSAMLVCTHYPKSSASTYRTRRLLSDHASTGQTQPVRREDGRSGPALQTTPGDHHRPHDLRDHISRVIHFLVILQIRFGLYLALLQHAYLLHNKFVSGCACSPQMEAHQWKTSRIW